MQTKEEITLTQEQLKAIDIAYKEACEKIATLEKELEQQKRLLPTLKPGDKVWCVLNINAYYKGTVSLKELYLDVPVQRKVSSITITENVVRYNLIDPIYNLIDRSATEEDLGVTVFFSYKDAYAKVLKNQNEVGRDA